MKAWEIRRAATALFLPNRCPFCGRLIGIWQFWCPECFEMLSFTNDNGGIPENLDDLRVVCEYSGYAKQAILRMKQGWYRYPIDAFAVLIAENAQEIVFQADFITAVPTGKERWKELGYAQSELIAKMICNISGKPFRRVLDVKPGKLEQKRLNAEQRRANAINSFVLTDPEKVHGRNILLIDDVCTTGSTLGAAAGLMKKSGAAAVNGAVFARPLLR